MALVLSLSPLVRASLYPYLMILQMTPIIVMAPILILWVGPGLKSVTIITFLICFFPMVVNTTQGLISTDRNLVDFFRMCKASKLPGDLPPARSRRRCPISSRACRIAATLAPIGAIVGDVYAGNSAGGQGGLGLPHHHLQLAVPDGRALRNGGGELPPRVRVCRGCDCASAGSRLHKWHDSFSQSDT